MDSAILKKQLHDQELPFRVLIVEHPELDFTLSVYVIHSQEADHEIGVFYNFERRGDIPRRHKSIASAYNEVKRLLGIGGVERVEVISYSTLATLMSDHSLIHRSYRSGLSDLVKKRRKVAKKQPEAKPEVKPEVKPESKKSEAKK